MSQDRQINLEIKKIKNLPPLSEESLRIISAVNDPDISIQALVDVISYMPSLTARLLGLANSAFFGRAVEITDLRTAIIQVLGLNLVKSIALSIALSAELDTSKCKLFDADFYWNHTLFTAIIAQKVAIELNDEQLMPKHAYSAGLLLNIGLLAAIYVAPQGLNRVFENTERIDGSVSEEMLKIFGLTQYEIGGVLMERWQLPEIYQTTVKQFKQKDYQGKQKRLVILLELCHWASVYIVTDKQEDMPDFSGLLEKLALSADLFSNVVEDTVNNKQSILEIASVIGN